MSAVSELETKLSNLKKRAEGDLHALVVKLEAIYQHVAASHTETVVKNAVVANVTDAANHVEALANTLESDVDTADKSVDSVVSEVTKEETE